MIQVNVHDAKSQLSRLIERVLAGEDVVIARAGDPVVRLVPLAPLPRVWGQDRGLVHIADDFDAPLPDELQVLFEDPGVFPNEP